MTEEGFELQLRLADPTRAADFVAAHDSLTAVPSASSVIAFMETWQQRTTESHSDIDILAGTLLRSPPAPLRSAWASAACSRHPSRRPP